MMATFEAIQVRVTGKDKSWANTSAGQKMSWTEIPNVLFFFALLFSQLVALIRFFEHENATKPWIYVSAMLFGACLVVNIGCSRGAGIWCGRVVGWWVLRSTSAICVVLWRGGGRSICAAFERGVKGTHRASATTTRSEVGRQ